MNFKKKSLLILGISAILISGCASNIVVPEVRKNTDPSLGCREIQAEIQTANMHKQTAQAENRFQAKFLFPPTGFWVMYKMIKATGNADKRISYLEELYTQKRCSSGGAYGGHNTGYDSPYGSPYQMRQAPSNRYGQPTRSYGTPPAGNFYQPQTRDQMRPDPYLGTMER